MSSMGSWRTWASSGRQRLGIEGPTGRYRLRVEGVFRVLVEHVLRRHFAPGLARRLDLVWLGSANRVSGRLRAGPGRGRRRVDGRIRIGGAEPRNDENGGGDGAGNESLHGLPPMGSCAFICQSP